MSEQATAYIGLREAADRLGVQPWRITYAMTAGYVQEPPRVAGKRVFDAAVIERLRKHFGVEEKADR